MFAIQITNTFSIKPGLLIALVYAALALWFVPGYVTLHANLLMGLALIPYICRVNTARRSLRYLLPALLVTILAVIVPVNTLFFIALLFAALLLAENTIGRVSDMVLFVVLLISPVFGHLTRLAEFPVRLWLSQKVADVLAFTGLPATAAGNQIVLNNTEFSVDPACAGLNMLVTSVLICLFVLAWYQRKLGKILSFKYLLLLSAVTVGLNVVCNFFRILLLVRFAIMPGTFLHDALGVGCLAVYVLLPLIAGIKPLLNRLGKPEEAMIKAAVPVPGLRYPFLHFGLLAALIFVAMHLTNADNVVNVANNVKLPGYHKKTLDGGIIKLENRDALIYLKPTAFYAPEHDPMICWTGSGYEFKNIRPETISGYQVYTATLEKNRDRIYSAWWFDNGNAKTINQFGWRWDAAKNGSRYFLVNVNASSPAALKQKAAELLKRNVFRNTPATSAKSLIVARKWKQRQTESKI